MSPKKAFIPINWDRESEEQQPKYNTTIAAKIDRTRRQHLAREFCTLPKEEKFQSCAEPQSLRYMA